MSTLALTNTFTKKTSLIASELQANFDDIANFLNCKTASAGIDANNIQASVGFSNTQVAEARGMVGNVGFVWINPSHATQAGVTSRTYWTWVAFDDCVIVSIDIIPIASSTSVTAKAYLQVYNPNTTTPAGVEVSYSDATINSAPRKALNIPIAAGGGILVSISTSDMTANVLSMAINIGLIANHTRL
jgi:hypothetical protein